MEKTYCHLADLLETCAPPCKPDKFLYDFEFATINEFQ